MSDPMLDAAREARTREAIERLLHPSSIAVVGATERLTYGGRFVRNLVQGGFSGQIYPVNPNRRTVFDLPCYPTLADLPERPDIAVLIVPAEGVLEILRQATALGVPGGIVISAGFGELGTEVGRQRQRELNALAAEGGPRLLGPNCLGFANLVDDTWSTASSQVHREALAEPPGAALISQSGASAFGPLGATARDRGLLYRYVVSTGNEADLGSEDFVDYFLSRPDIRVVSMLIEGFRDIGRLRRLAARAVEADKTLVVLKVGRSEVGQRAARSHTAALTGSDAVQDALFRQFGIVRVRDYDELIEQTSFFLKAPWPGGKRIGVVSHSGGIGTHLSDLLGEQGLAVPPLSASTQRELAAVLGERGSASNPADITTFANSPSFGPILASLLADPGLDGWLVATQGSDELVGKIIAAAAATPRPVAVAWTGSQYASAGLPLLRASPVPLFSFPSGAARGMAALVKRARARAEQPVASELPELQIPAAGGTLSEHDSKRLLAEVGIGAPQERLCRDGAAAAAAADLLGYPVVLKACSPDLAHKSDRGLVRLDLRTPEEVRRAAVEVLEAAGLGGSLRLDGLLVQPYVRGGVETIVGLSNDDQLGIVLMLGLGGTLVETLGAVTWRACPIDQGQAETMIDDLPVLAALLGGVRGAPPADRAALAQALARLSSFGSRLGPRLETVDVNPLLVRSEGQGVLALDALVSLRSGA